jgi:biopolymer transport protein ExbD
MDEKEFDYMNVIPLVDVMLVLLTIVLTTSTFIATGAIPVELPKASASMEEALTSVAIEIDSHENMYLNAEPVSLATLRTALAKMERASPVLIRADHAIGLQLFVDVLDVVKTLGFTRVSLQTERKA